jgi:hypothetical protein
MIWPPYYDVLLRGSQHTQIGLYDLFQATSEQLTRLHYSPGSLKMVKRRLKELADMGYVEAKAYSIEHEGKLRKLYFSPRYYYVLGPRAKRYFEDQGYEMPEGWRTHRPEDKRGVFMDHELERNDIVIAAALVRHIDPRIVLERFQHARIFAHEPIKVTVNGQSQKLIPDGLLDFRNTSTDLHFVSLLEHDKGTEPEAKFKAKIRKYVALMTAEQGEYYERVLHSDYANIAFTTFAGVKRLNDMREWTEEVLRETYASHELRNSFRFAALPQPISPGVAWLEPRWLTPQQGEDPKPLLIA